MTLPTLAVATDRFHLKPLLQLLSGDGQFYILALSQNQVRLFQGNRYHVSGVELTDLPTSMAEALQLDNPQQNLQFHTGTSQGGGGDRATFHSKASIIWRISEHGKYWLWLWCRRLFSNYHYLDFLRGTSSVFRRSFYQSLCSTARSADRAVGVCRINIHRKSTLKVL